MEFNVGDRVVVIKNFGLAKVGLTGRIIGFVISDGERYIAVEFDENIGGHDAICGNPGKPGHYYFVKNHHIKIIDEIPYDPTEAISDLFSLLESCVRTEGM